MFNVKLYTSFNLLFIVIFFFKITYENKPLFLILSLYMMSRCEFKEIFVFKNFEIENGVLGLDRDCYLIIVKFLDSSTLRKVSLNISV
jgi:hypothetical protein